ncbi:hypothetical protein [Bradyrhizobium sp. LeoA1S1]
MTALSSYSTGTVSISDGDTTVVGSGTIWSAANARAGDVIIVDDLPAVEIKDTADTSHLELWSPWTGGNKAGVNYTIVQKSPLRFAGSTAMADVSRMVAALNTDGFYVFVAPDLTEPDPSYGDENQFALQPDTGKLWLKTGGVWVFQGIYKGFSIRGPWSAATAYQVGDVVSLSGSSYVALAPSTNQSPPNATYWQVLAAKGDTGSTGPQGASYGGSSTTSLAIGTGSKTFAIGTGYAYQVGNYVRASSAANGANFMEGFVTAYSGGNITINVTRVNGSGTFADWNFSVSGAPGAGNGDLLAANHLTDVTLTAPGTGGVARPAADIILDVTNVRNYGAKGDAKTITATVTIASGSNALTATGATFTSADVGKTILVPGAGAAGVGLVTTISAFTDATHVTLAASAGTALSAVSKRVTYGTDDTASFNAALVYANTSALTLHARGATYLIAGTINLSGAGTTLKGDGIRQTILLSPNPGNVVISVPHGMTEIRIKDLWIDRAETVVASPSGNGIEWAVAGQSDGQIEQVRVSRCYVGMKLGSTGLSWLLNCRTDYNVSHGVLIINNPSFPVCQWYTDSIYTAANGGIGFCIATDPGANPGGMSTGNISKVFTFANGSFGIAALGQPTCPVQGLRMSDCFLGNDLGIGEVYLDTYGNDHMLQNFFVELGGHNYLGGTVPCSGIFATANNAVVMLNHINCNGNTTHGFNINSTFTQMNGCKSTNNGNLGVFMNDGNKVLMVGCYTAGNAGGSIGGATTGLTQAGNKLL